MGRVVYLEGFADQEADARRGSSSGDLGSLSRKPYLSADRRHLLWLLYAPAALFLIGLSAPWLFGTWSKIASLVASAPQISGPASIIDGDTIDIRGERIRLHGIDAPETGQQCQNRSGEPYRCGQKAAFALADRIGGHTVRCEILDRDRYSRHVGRCFVGETDLNAWMVAQGQAVAYRRFSSEYVPLEAVARAERLGTWEGYFDLPWDWRSGDRRGAGGGTVVKASAARKSGCDIKGNSSGNGRIYHLPGQQYYERTAIDPAKGERWFCSEAEAQSAGWRRASR